MTTPKKHETFTMNHGSDIFFTNSSEKSTTINPLRNHTKSSIFNEQDQYTSNSTSTLDVKLMKPHHKKTKIFFGNDSNPNPDSDLSSISTSNKKSTGNKDFTPNFMESSAYERRLKEFWPYVEKPDKSITSKLGVLSKETYELSNKKREDMGDPYLTAKDRKLIQNYTSFTIDEIKRITTETNQSEEIYVGCKGYNPNKDSKTNKVEFLKSNIFNDPEKTDIYQKFENVKIQDEECNTPKIQLHKTKVTVPFNPWNAKIDWKDDKNEILFHKEYATEDNSSPLTRKIKNLQDHFEGPLSEANFTPNTKNLAEEKAIEDKEEILNSFKGNIKDEPMIRKNMELSSINQGTEFYKSNAKYYSTLDCAVSKYEVNDIKDFENLKEKEIENLFRNKGYAYLIN